MALAGDRRLSGLWQMGRLRRAAALTREGGSRELLLSNSKTSGAGTDAARAAMAPPGFWPMVGPGAVWEQWTDDGRRAFGWL